MNLPNKLTLLRLCLVPVLWVFLSIGQIWAQVLALLVFIGASLTDMMDGRIARSQNLVTDFGKFVDPIADKVLVTAAMIVLLRQGRMTDWAVFLFIAREFVIAALRQVAARKGKVIAADKWGKYKTITQMVGICMLIGFTPVNGVRMIPWGFFTVLSHIVIYVALLLSMISCFNYVYTNRSVFDSDI